MFEDFLEKNYNKESNKIREVRNLINRIGASNLEEKVLTLEDKINRLHASIEDSEKLSIDRREEREGEIVAPSLPDLIVSEIKTTSYTNFINLEITVKNQGSKLAGASDLSINITGQNIVNYPTPALNPEQSHTINHQYSIDPLGDEANITIAATADGTNKVLEQNENNNTLSQTVKTRPFQRGGIICHMHNPEGKEISNVLFLHGNTDDDRLWLFGLAGAVYIFYPDSPVVQAIYYIGGPSTTDPGIHGVPLFWGTFQAPGIPSNFSGNLRVVAFFNGMVFDEEHYFEEDKVKELIFVFPRTEHKVSFSHSVNIDIEKTLTVPGSSYAEYTDKGVKLKVNDYYNEDEDNDSLSYKVQGVVNYNEKNISSFLNAEITSISGATARGGLWAREDGSELWNVPMDNPIPINSNFDYWLAYGETFSPLVEGSGDIDSRYRWGINMELEDEPYAYITLGGARFVPIINEYYFGYGLLESSKVYSQVAFSEEGAIASWDVTLNSITGKIVDSAPPYSGSIRNVLVASVPYDFRGDSI